MKELLSLLTFICITLPAASQTLTLDSCRAMAIRNNRQLAIGEMEKDVVLNLKKAARTKYLPRVNALGGYEWMSREVSLLNTNQKSQLNSLGTNIANNIGGKISTSISSILGDMITGGMITRDQAMFLGDKLTDMAGGIGETIQQTGNSMGEKVTEAFRTDTRNIWAGTVAVTQPLYMGGAITALNNIADINERLANDDYERRHHDVLYEIDNTYWLVVSLKHKQELAKSFNKLVSHLNDDVEKMIREGVATKADGLKVAVKVNESEMALTQATNGIALAKMLLCQQCGMPLDSEIRLADEEAENLVAYATVDDTDIKGAIEQRPETRMLANAVDLSKEMTRLTRAAFLPQAGLTAGYLVSNPNVFDGFRNKFGGVWNVGVIVRIPVWNWSEGIYKVRATKTATAMAQLELSDAKEKMELQVNQQRYKVEEAKKRLAMANKNISSAEENLRCADLGFKEGVMGSTEVIAAQTAWYMAQSQKIDAEIDVRMSLLGLKKALGR